MNEQSMEGQERRKGVVLQKIQEERIEAQVFRTPSADWDNQGLPRTLSNILEFAGP